MKRISGSLFLKMLSFVMVCVAAPILGICILCAYEAYDTGIYQRAVTFDESTICKNFVTENLAEIREYMYWNDISGLKDRTYYNEHGNFAYTVYDEHGKIVYSTIRKDMNFELIVKDYPAREVDEKGDITAEYTINGYISKNITDKYDGYEEYTKFQFLKRNREEFITYGVICFAVCAFLCIYLFSAAGYNREGELACRGLNAVLYDITAGLCTLGFIGLANLYIDLLYPGGDALMKLFGVLLVFMGMTAVVLIFAISSAVHFKMKQWWKHTFIYECFHIFGKFFRWIMDNIGITWKISLAVLGYSFLIFALGLFTVGSYNEAFFLLLAIFITVAATCGAIWFGSQLKKIKRGGEAIANGDFDYRINARELWPMLRKHAYNLNCAALGMSKAVDDRMKSERFKTELITNVSHDLKTPLTSIVSYVDLLKKEKIENENALEYIEVIDRQSAKLKKLTEDLVEASKATSGAVSVNKETLNIGELINQSVGEFSEKLEAAEIIPVINLPEKEIAVFTDGRLLWRVFDNLIQNIIKYAQPGTRAYFDLSEEDKNAVLTIKNISKEPLNMTAEALMERFVRGDASRNSEGNGLGLSIAKSLTELCGGTFELSLDGDLYKVTIKIPSIIPEEN